MPTAPHQDPHNWFDAWFGEASQTISNDPNAMTLATADAAGHPSSRVVLLKEWDARGFVFYTNRKSRKGEHLAANPHASLNFFWRDLGRQIRIEGSVESISDAESDEYFASRPRGSQIGAWASLQSSELTSRDELIARTKELEDQYDGVPVPRPPHWGGYRVVPLLIEFWESGEFRLHDRWEFRRDDADTDWQVRRLFP